MNKKITLEVAIAAYNAEKNIKRLTKSILNQKEDSFILKKIIVNSDSSSDNTVSVVSSIKDRRLKVVNSHKRSGFADTFISLTKSSKSDVLLILNDDIIVTDVLFLEKLIQPFLSEKKIGLVCSNAQALKSNNFVSEAVRSGYTAFKRMGEHINKGNNVFTADGKSLCLSRKFIRSIKFPKDTSEMANVDAYIYMTCKANGFEYRYIKNSILYFKCPSTIKDFIKWQIRSYQTNNHVIPARFGDLTKEEYAVPRIMSSYYKLAEFLKNPLGGILVLFLGFYCTLKAWIDKNHFDKTWDLVQTTKDI